MTTVDDSKDRLLLVTLSNIGDAIMTTPVLQTMHRLCPQARIDIVVDKRSRELFEYCPWRGQLFEKDKQAFLRGLPSLLRRLRQRRYRLVVDLRTDGMAWLVRAAERRHKFHAHPAAVHAVEKHLSIIRALAGDRLVTECCLWPGDAARRHAAAITGTPADNRKILCVAAGANARKKIWPADNFRDLINQLTPYYDQVLLLGNSRERKMSAAIAAAAERSVVNLCGETSLLQTAAVLEQAALFVGNDSGLGHMAAAAGIPTCTLFGPGQADIYRPWGSRATWLVATDGRVESIRVADVVSRLQTAGHLS